MTECVHEDEVLFAEQHAPVDAHDATAHTTFFVLGCTRCRRAVAFPPDNFALVTPAFRAQLVADIQLRGYTVPSAPPEQQRRWEPPERRLRWRLRYKVLGGHVHCRVYTAPRGLAFAKAGDLVFALAEWPHVAEVLREAGIEPEEEGPIRP